MNKNESYWRQALLLPSATIQDVILNLDQVAIKIVLVVDETGELKGTISDGDIRRGLLRGLAMDSPITTLINRNALVAPADLPRDTVLQLMVSNKIQQIPVVDDRHHVVGLHLWEEMNTPKERPNVMIIMAGGKGTRLRPHTENCPKPMLPVHGKPMLEHIIESARTEGFSNFILAVHYLGHIIEEHFGNGDRFKVRIEYLREETPLGTAGALSLLTDKPNEPFVVTNGDVLTDIRYGQLLDFHTRHEAAATMAVRAHEWQNQFGVVRTQGIEITGFDEKPVVRSHINAGVYVISPEALESLNLNERCDMPTLFERLQTEGLRTVAYPMHEPWLDVGRPSDYEIAQRLDITK